jgi:hypothetical protein
MPSYGEKQKPAGVNIPCGWEKNKNQQVLIYLAVARCYRTRKYHAEMLN